MTGKTIRIALSAPLLIALAACGNDAQQGTSILGGLRDATMGTIASRKADKTAPAPRDPQAIAAEALSVNPGPLILVGLEGMNSTQVLAMTGQNGAMRTYMTGNEQALILRNGILVGTRGLGNDLSVAEASGPAALVLSGRSGQARRVMHYYTGDGLERALPMNCTVRSGPKPGVMVEDCEGLGASFQNSYLVSGGRADVSRQWIGPALGYVTIQTLRP